MELSRMGREYYEHTITTDPPVSAWQASFDGGTTWVDAEVVDDLPEDAPAGALHVRWLVAGPDVTANPDGTPVITRETTPKVRATDDPEVVVRGAPVIRLV